MLGILGFIFVIIATVYTYRTAKSNGHNAVLWMLTAFAVGFGVQIIIPFIIGVVLGIVLMTSGHSIAEVQSMIQAPAGIIGFICLFISIIGVVLVLRRASTIREDDTLPPPPDFYQNG